jgi:hypothetical protein
VYPASLRHERGQTGLGVRTKADVVDPDHLFFDRKAEDDRKKVE